MAPCPFPDLTKTLFNQIGACSMVLGVPYRPGIIGLLVVMNILDPLLELKLFEDLKVNQDGVKFFPTAPLVLEYKACTLDDFLTTKGN